MLLTVFMPFITLTACMQEWGLSASSKDNYVLRKMHLMRRW